MSGERVSGERGNDHPSLPVEAATPARATGFVSAVLLVVLLATTGWPPEARPFVEGAHATSCEPRLTQAAGSFQQSDTRLELQSTAVTVALPRMLPRQQRVDSWGLPPPRAPCA